MRARAREYCAKLFLIPSSVVREVELLEQLLWQTQVEIHTCTFCCEASAAETLNKNGFKIGAFEKSNFIRVLCVLKSIFKRSLRKTSIT